MRQEWMLVRGIKATKEVQIVGFSEDERLQPVFKGELLLPLPLKSGVREWKVNSIVGVCNCAPSKAQVLRYQLLDFFRRLGCKQTQLQSKLSDFVSLAEEMKKAL
jgi:hypothetical protein